MQHKHIHNPKRQVDYWLPDPDIVPIKFKIQVLKPDHQGQMKGFKKARGMFCVCCHMRCLSVSQPCSCLC